MQCHVGPYFLSKASLISLEIAASSDLASIACCAMEMASLWREREMWGVSYGYEVTSSRVATRMLPVFGREVEAAGSPKAAPCELRKQSRTAPKEETLLNAATVRGSMRANDRAGFQSEPLSPSHGLPQRCRASPGDAGPIAILSRPASYLHVAMLIHIADHLSPVLHG